MFSCKVVLPYGSTKGQYNYKDNTATNRQYTIQRNKQSSHKHIATGHWIQCMCIYAGDQIQTEDSKAIGW